MSDDKDMWTRPIIARVGGKSKLADDIVNMMPRHEIYVEPFIGGGSVFFKKPKSLSRLEVINDKDKDVADIYRDVQKVESLSDKSFQPTRPQFNRLKNMKNFKTDKERLFRNLYLSLTSFRGDRENYIGENLENDKRYKNVGVKFKNQKTYDKIRNRMSGVKVHSEDFRKVIKRYDSPDTLFYLDPPYSRAEQNKDYREVGLDIYDVCNFLKTIKGKFILSYDDVVDARKICKQFKIKKIRTKYETTRKNAGAYDVSELIITNF